MNIQENIRNPRMPDVLELVAHKEEQEYKKMERKTLELEKICGFKNLYVQDTVSNYCYHPCNYYMSYNNYTQGKGFHTCVRCLNKLNNAHTIHRDSVEYKLYLPSRKISSCHREKTSLRPFLFKCAFCKDLLHYQVLTAFCNCQNENNIRPVAIHDKIKQKLNL